jgi:hypothetical protein
MIKKHVSLILLLVFYSASLFSQDLSKMMDQLSDSVQIEAGVEKTFRTPRIVCMHSVENPARGELIFNIEHRFGKINTGLYEMFGLDQATMRLGFDYGINNWLGVGIGRSTFQKTVDVFAKARLIKQKGRINFPFTLVYYGSASINTLRNVYPAENDGFTDRITFVNSLLVARKFGESFSLQLSPIWLRSNYLTETSGAADEVSLGIETRVKLSRRVHLNLEYIHEIVDEGLSDQNPLSVGFDIETGGHVFQLFFSNAQGVFDKAYLINTRDSWPDGGIFFGFNITRVFYFNE